MIFFSIVELLNKFLGLYITGYLARILTPADLGIYLSVLVTFGYAIEIGYFGSQSRHNADFALDPEYLSSKRFIARKALTAGFTALAAVFLLGSLQAARGYFHVAPLLIALACVPFSFDYVAYGSRRSQLIVAARLCSQLVAVAWVYIVAHGLISTRELLWGQSLQTCTLTLVVIVGLRWMKRLPGTAVAAGVTKFPIARDDLRVAVRDQSKAFGLRVLALALVSGELLLLTIVGNGLSGELATSLRLVQVIFPFVVFYVDSSVVRVTRDGLRPYVRLVFAAVVLLLLASPAIVVVLFGRSYAAYVAQIDGFLPAFILQALLQYSIMVSLKDRSEGELLLRLLLPIVVGAALLTGAVVRGATLFELEVIYAIKATLFVLIVPGLTRSLRVAGIAVVVGVSLANPALDHVGYYDAVTSFIGSLLR
jgi:hypothetical protein